MKSIQTLFLSLFLVTISYANQLDSLQSMLHNTSDAKARIPILLQLMIETEADKNSELYFGYAQQLLEDASQQRDIFALAKRKESLALHYYFGNRLDSTIVIMKDAVKLFESENYLEEAINCKRKVATFYARMGQFSNSEKMLKEIIQQAQPDSLKKQLAYAYNAMGNTFGRQDKLDSAMVYFIKSENTFLAINDTIGMLRPINGRTSVLTQQKKYDEALVLLHQVKDIRKKLNLRHNLMDSYSYLASVYDAKADFENALYYSKETLKLAEELNDNSVKAHVLLTISSIYLNNADYENSLDYCNQGIAVNNDSNLENLVSGIALKGNILNLMERWEETIQTIQEALSQLSKEKKHPQLSLFLAEAYLRKGDIKAANQIANELKQEEIVNSLPIYRDHYYQFLAELHFEEEAYSQAIKYGKLGLENFAQKSKFSASSSLAKLIADSYEKLGNYQQALNHQRLFKTYSDSLNNIAKTRRITQQIKDYEFELEKQVIAAEQFKREAELKAKTRQIRTTAAGIGVLAILGFSFFWNARRKNKIILSQNKELEQLNTTKDRIFAIISHDLRKPALAFRGISKKVKFLVQQKEFETLDKFGASIEKSAYSLNGLLDNLLNWSLQQREVLPYRPTAINVTEVTAEIYELFDQIAADKNIDLQMNIPESTLVFADFNAYATIIRNLVDNAIKYTPEGGVIELLAEKIDKQIAISVVDTGVGIPPEKINQLFELQQNKSSQGTSGEKGSGLGLTLVKDLVELNRGKIRVISEVNKGTTFELLLPAA